jgi:hypothetical protein
MYNKAFFVEFFTSVPPEMWNSGNVYDEHTGTSCAIGLLGNRQQLDVRIAEPAIAVARLNKLFRDNDIFHKEYGNAEQAGWNIAEVNNGNHPQFQQAHPKDRILAALEFCKDSWPVTY